MPVVIGFAGFSYFVLSILKPPQFPPVIRNFKFLNLKSEFL